MSVLFEFAIFPTDKGESVSPYVGRVLKMIDDAGVPYKLTPMGTVIEVETMEEALSILERAYRQLEPDCDRVYSTIKFDIRKGRSGRLTRKVESLEQKVGRKLST